ncbi:helix-turn-helix domain-containing protein [Celerinatantimonas sp. MCCC 1A17872]|uniref:helix-turn-helix domain-containing protein n=1 Tax=Celerinatantimonas sp. MCCC 1A17872 TaxID=3177514 RepID=UPI0038C44D3F
MNLSRPEMTFHWRDSVNSGRQIISQEKQLAPQPEIRPLSESAKKLRGICEPVRSENLEKAMVEYLTTKTTMRRAAKKWGISPTTLCRHLGKLNRVSRGKLLANNLR